MGGNISAGMPGRVSGRIVDWAKRSGFLRLLVVITLVAELITGLVNIANIYTWWGEHPAKLLLVGVIDAFLVSIIALPAIILIIQRLKQAEADEASKSSYLDNILDSSIDMAIAATDIDFRVTLFNPAAEEMFGYHASEVMGRDIRQLHKGEGVHEDRFAAAMEALNRDGEFSFSLALPKVPGGELRYLDVRLSGITGRDGRTAGYVLMARDVTERRRAENALRESEERFRSLVESSSDWVWEMDAHSRYTYSSPKVIDILGFRPDEVIGKTPYDMMMPVEARRSKSVFGVYASIGKPCTAIESMNVHKDGRLIVLETSGVPIHDQRGELCGYRGISRDITGRRRFETALSESEAKFRLLSEESLVGVYILRGERFVYVNPRFAQITGYNRDDIVKNKRLDDLITKESMERVRQKIKMRLSGKAGSAHYELQGIRSDGALINVEVLGSVTTYNGMPAIIGTLMDVTERRRAETALRESEQKFRTLVEHSLFGVAIIQDGKYAYVNPRHAEMLGYTPEEMMALDNILERVHPDDRDMVIENVRKRETGEVRDIRYQFRFLKKNGETVHVEVHGSTAEYGGKPAVLSSVQDITDRVQAEAEIIKLNKELERRVEERTAELRESESRYRMLMEQASDGIGTMSPDGKITGVNRRLCEILGYDHEEVLSLTLPDIFVQEELPLVMADLVDIRSGATVVRERTVRRKDGSTLQAEISAKILDDGSVLAIGRDITARKEAERALRSSEARLRHVVQHMPVMMNAFAEDGSIIVWNRECERVTGYTEEEIVGRPDAMKMLCPDGEYLERMMAEWRQKGNNYRDWEWELTCKDGSVKTVSWSNRSDVISIPGWANWGIGIDVTERNRAQEELGEREHSYRTLAENLPGIVYRVFLREGNRMQCFNEMQEPLTGYTAADLKPGACCSVDPLILPDDRERVIETVREAVAKDTPFLVEYRLRHKDGSIRHMQERGRPVRGPDGKPLYVDGVILDITELMRAQEEREAMMARLNEAQKMEAIGNLAGGITHDFNNFLTVIRADTELAMKAVSEEGDAYQYLAHVDSAASRAHELVKKLLIFSRRQPMARMPMDVNSVVDETMGMLGRVIGDNIAVETRLGPGIQKILADRSGVEQVVMNLALNARDAMPEGGRLTISTSGVRFDEDSCHAVEGARPGRYVRLSVTDTGTGMDEDTVRHIFEPFFSTKGRGKGTGLGLSMVYGIVREHGGWINVRSSPGEGSTFEIYLDAADAGLSQAAVK